MKDLSGASMKDLTRAQRTLNAELRGMNRSTAEGKKAFAEKSQQLQKVQGEIKRTTAQMKGFQNQGGMVNKTLGQLKLGYLAVAGALYGAFRGISRLMEAYDGRIKANETLLFALNQEEAVQRRLIRLASDMQSRLGIDDDVLKEQMTFLAMQGRTELQIKNTMKAAAELSKVMGIGLQQAILYLDGTMEGNIGRLGRLDAGFTKLTTEQLRNGAAVDLINEKYGGLAEKSFEQGLGPLRRFQNAWGDLQKTLGGFLVNALLPVFNGLSRGMDNLNKSFDNFLTNSNDLFSDQVQTVAELETNIRPLLSRYEELADKSQLSTIEQQELKTIIDQVTTALPGAASGFDEYGQAISISTDRVREFIDQQIAMMQYQNRAAIKEVEKDIRKVNKELSRIAPDISQIERTGTYQVLTREYNKLSQQWVASHKDASQEMVQETIKKNQELLFERKGMIARLEALNGDELQKEIERREEERKAAQELEKQRIEYRKKSTEELKRLASQGDQLAIDQLAQLGDSATVTRTAYVQLTQAISQGKEALSGFVAEGNYAAAEQQAAALKVLESQKAIIDEIVLAGGTWQNFMDKLRNNEFVRLMERNEAAVTEFLETLQISTDQGIDDLLETLDAENDKQLEGFQKVGEKAKKIPEEWAATWTEFAQIGSDAAFNIIKNNQQATLDEKLSNLRKQRDAELANEKLTASQREAIEGKYRKQEVKIKQEAFRKQKAADITQALINTALAVTKSLSAAPPPANAILAALSAAAGAAQVAVIASQKVPQFARGRYDVLGQDDNRLYRQVPFAGLASTGIYERPALIAERGAEIVVDAATTKNIRLNYPGILDAIQRVRVPQYASGRLPEREPSASPQTTAPMFTEEGINKLMKAAQIFEEASESLRRDGVTGRWYLQDFDEINNNKAKIENKLKI
jgi:hypothetical protein